MNGKGRQQLHSILARQNRDGGFPYGEGGVSWTEPTALALLALSAFPGSHDSFVAGARWLRRGQRGDGGWAPSPQVDASTWVTALALLLPAQPGEGLDRRRALEWLSSQTPPNSRWLYRIRRRLLGDPVEDIGETLGWPWYPGTAAWLLPTCLTLLALERAGRESSNDRIRERIAAGRQFLIARQCRDGGWNHGSARALGIEADSYPETTGAALLALHGVATGSVKRGVAAAEKHWAQCRSAEGFHWLRLGLLAHGRRPPEVPTSAKSWTTVDLALSVLADAAENGLNVFFGSTT